MLRLLGTWRLSTGCSTFCAESAPDACVPQRKEPCDAQLRGLRARATLVARSSPPETFLLAGRRREKRRRAGSRRFSPQWWTHKTIEDRGAGAESTRAGRRRRRVRRARKTVALFCSPEPVDDVEPKKTVKSSSPEPKAPVAEPRGAISCCPRDSWASLSSRRRRLVDLVYKRLRPPVDDRDRRSRFRTPCEPHLLPT